MFKSFIKELGLMLRFSREVLFKEQCDKYATIHKKYHVKQGAMTLGALITLLVAFLFISNMAQSQASTEEALVPPSKAAVLTVKLEKQVQLNEALLNDNLKYKEALQRYEQEYSSRLKELEIKTKTLEKEKAKLEAKLAIPPPTVKSVPKVKPNPPAVDTAIFDDVLEIY